MSGLEYLVHPNVHDLEGHVHSHAHILLATQEPLIVRCGSSDLFVTPQQLGFVPPGLYHQCLCSSEIIIIDIPAEMIKPPDLAVLSKHVLYPLTGCFVPLVELIKSEIKRNPGVSINYLYYFLYEKLLEVTASKSICYIREHFNEDINIEELAKLENYSVSYFKDWFKQKTGWAPSTYLRNLRLDKAKELLVTSRLTILEIAVRVGYNSHSALTRAFQKQEHISPIAYRNQVRANNAELIRD